MGWGGVRSEDWVAREETKTAGLKKKLREILGDEEGNESGEGLNARIFARARPPPSLSPLHPPSLPPSLPPSVPSSLPLYLPPPRCLSLHYFCYRVCVIMDVCQCSRCGCDRFIYIYNMYIYNICRNNQIGDAGCTALAAALPCVTTLQYLGLRCSPLLLPSRKAGDARRCRCCCGIGQGSQCSCCGMGQGSELATLADAAFAAV